MSDRFDPTTNEQMNAKIDNALRQLNAAQPPLGMEARVLARLEERLAADEARRPRWRMPQLAWALAAAGCVCAVLIAGSITHSRRMAPTVPGVHLPAVMGTGLGAAAAARVTSHPVTAPVDSRPRSVRCAETASAQSSHPNRQHSDEAASPCPAEGSATHSPASSTKKSNTQVILPRVLPDRAPLTQ